MQCKYRLICTMCHLKVDAETVGNRDQHVQVQKAAMVTCKELNAVMAGMGILKVMPHRS